MNKHTENFLEAVLWSYPWEDSELEEGNFTIHDVDSDFVQIVESFINGFIRFLESREIEIVEFERSFGGNCYFSISGHGVGFWDSPETKHFQDLIESYAGNKYKWEGINFWEENGILKVDY